MTLCLCLSHRWLFQPFLATERLLRQPLEMEHGINQCLSNCLGRGGRLVVFSGLSYQRGWDMLQSQMHLGVSETFEPQQDGGRV